MQFSVPARPSAVSCLSYSSVFSSAGVPTALLPFIGPVNVSLGLWPYLCPLCAWALFANLLPILHNITGLCQALPAWQPIRVVLGDNIVPWGTDDGRRRAGEEEIGVEWKLLGLLQRQQA